MDVGAGSLGGLVKRRSRSRRLGVTLGRLMRLPIIGSWIARLARFPNRLRGTSQVTRFHAWLLRASGGRLRRSWLFAAGQPVLSLTTTGRRTGKSRSTAVACFTAGEDLVIAGMNLGLERDPAWVLNLEANPRATIELDGTRTPVLAQRAVGERADQLWRRWAAVQPSAEALRDLAGREIPLFVLRRAA